MRAMLMGYSLHHTNTLVFMKAPINPMYEKQEAKQVSRLSQTATRTTIYQLVMKESKIKNMIMQAQHLKADSTRLTLSYLNIDKNATRVSSINYNK